MTTLTPEKIAELRDAVRFSSAPVKVHPPTLLALCDAAEDRDAMRERLRVAEHREDPRTGEQIREDLIAHLEQQLREDDQRAWEALGKPEGTYAGTNVERLCLKLATEHARAERHARHILSLQEDAKEHRDQLAVLQADQSLRDSLADGERIKRLTAQVARLTEALEKAASFIKHMADNGVPEAELKAVIANMLREAKRE